MTEIKKEDNPDADSTAEVTTQGKVKFEEIKWEDEKLFRREEIAIKKRELDLKLSEQKKFRYTNPLVVAILAAALAGTVNAIVVFANNLMQLDTEDYKIRKKHELDESMAEGQRLFEVLKAGEASKSIIIINSMIEAGLIKGSEKVEYFKKISASKAAAATPTVVIHQSGWISGGHTDQENCTNGISKYTKAYPGNKISIVSTDQTSRRSLFGHVEYYYSCVLSIS